MRLELTRQGDYGIRAMVALAAQTGTTWLSVPKMSAEMAIPERVLPKVMADLVRAGLVEGRIGRTGGYRLARPAASITLLDVIAALEPEPDTPVCVLRGGPCGLDGRCAVHDAFSGAREAMLQRLDTVSLDDVVRLGLPFRAIRPMRGGSRVAQYSHTHSVCLYVEATPMHRSHFLP